MNDALILCYHGVSETWPARISVTPSALERQLELLAARGYRGVTFSRAALDAPSGRTVAVTFDDAYSSVRELAFPVLARLGFPGTVFVPTGFPGGEPMRWPGVDAWHGGPHEGELVRMTWDQLRDLSEARWEIGSHTHSHPRLPELDDDSLARELGESREECERRLGGACTSLAYPYGDHDPRVAAAAGRAGYLAACGVRPIDDPAAPLRRSRVGVYRADDMRRFRLKISPRMRWLRSGPAWGLVRRVGSLGRS